MAKITKEEALRYHAEGKPGKIEVVPTKPYSTQMDLSLAYRPALPNPVWKSKRIRWMLTNIRLKETWLPLFRMVPPYWD